MLPERPSVSNAESFHAVKTSDSVQTIVVVRFAKSRTYAELYLSYSLDRQAPAPNCSTFVNENRTNDSCRSHRSVVHELGLLLRPSVSAAAREVVSINEPRAFTTAVSNDATSRASTVRSTATKCYRCCVYVDRRAAACLTNG